MDKLVIKIGSTQVHLSGSGIVAPVKGCRRNPCKDQGESVLEKIDVMLHGLPEVLDDWIKMIEALFSRVDLGEQGLLILKTAATVQEYESKIFSVKLELAGLGSADLKRGSLGVIISIVRDNVWEGLEVTVPLSNGYGTDVIDGLRLDNQYHANTSKMNHANISGADIDGEIPAPAIVKIKHEDGADLNLISNIIVSLDIISNLLPGDTFLEGSLANSSLNYGAVTNSAASQGAYGLVQWESTSALKLVSWGISDLAGGRFAGRLVRPVLRMHDKITTADYWLRIKVNQGEAAEYTRWQKVVPNKKMMVFPAIHIPAKNLQSAEIWGVTVALEGQRQLSGTHVLTIDDIDLFPVDGFRHYYHLGNRGIQYGETLVDDPENDLIYSISFGFQNRLLTHQATGKGIWLMPGEDQCIRVKWDRNNADCNPNQHIKLSMSYRPRRINL